MQEGVDIIIAQGYEAGGHTGEVATMVLIPDVVDAIAPVPVLAAGGIGTGRQMAAAMALGADGVWTGSIWLTVSENTERRRRHRQAARRHLDRHGALARVHRQAGPPAAHRRGPTPGRRPSRPGTLPMPLQFMLNAYANRKMGRTRPRSWWACRWARS